VPGCGFDRRFEDEQLGSTFAHIKWYSPVLVGAASTKARAPLPERTIGSGLPPFVIHDLVSHRETKGGLMKHRYFTLSLTCGLLGGTLIVPTAQNSYSQAQVPSPPITRPEVLQLPEPSGLFDIGRVGYEWVDISRPDGHSTDPQAHRGLMVYVWYPSLKGKAEEIGEYLPGANLEVDHFGQRRGFNDAQNVEYLKKKEDQLNKCPAGSYDVLLKSAGLVHASFSDYPLLAANGQPTKTELSLHNLRLTESFILAFLDKNLKQASEPLLDREQDHPEATVTRYGH
jgi:hypothetical protein